MKKGARKFLTFVILIVLLISFIYIWYMINKSSWQQPIKHFLSDDDLFNLIFRNGLSLVVGATFLTLIAFIIKSIFGVKIR